MAIFTQILTALCEICPKKANLHCGKLSNLITLLKLTLVKNFSVKEERWT